MWRCRSADVRVWRRRSADVRVWRCRSADVRVWRCMLGCKDVDQQMWGCEDVLQRLLFYKEPFAGALGKKCNKPLQQLIDSAMLSQSNWDPRCDRSPFLESSMWHQSQPVSLERDRTCYRSNRQSTPSNENESTKEPTGGIGVTSTGLCCSVYYKPVRALTQISLNTWNPGKKMQMGCNHGGPGPQCFLRLNV